MHLKCYMKFSVYLVYILKVHCCTPHRDFIQYLIDCTIGNKAFQALSMTNCFLDHPFTKNSYYYYYYYYYYY